jgi:hypothetical protein
MQHSSHPQEMTDAVAWLHQRLPQVLPSEADLRAMTVSNLKRLAASRCDALALVHIFMILSWLSWFQHRQSPSCCF